MTTAPPPVLVTADAGVYAPQSDSWLLCEAATTSGLVSGARVLDMCTGSGVVAVAAARLGARSVTAFDISAEAVACASRNACDAGVGVDARVGSFADAAALGPFEVVLCNPPYVPSPVTPSDSGLHRAWDAGSDGRLVLDPLCAFAARLVAPGGTMLIVQSQMADAGATVATLSGAGFRARVTERQVLKFGPVLRARARWLEQSGHVDAGRRTEELVIIRADRPPRRA